MPQRTRDPGQAVIACHARPRRRKKPSAVRKFGQVTQQPLIDYPVTFGAWCEATGYDSETRTYQEAVTP